MDHSATLAGSYDHRLVALSVLISFLASYAALDLGGRVTASQGHIRRIWHLGGSFTMGLGIWAMHYVGMLAWSLPIPVYYDWPTVLLSLLAAVLASGVALFVVSRSSMGILRIGVGGISMGSGIAAMHYIGMAAMRVPAMCQYSPALVLASVVLAVVIAMVALYLTFRLRDVREGGGWRKSASALLMGAAIPVMHYTGMAAVTLVPLDRPVSLTHAVEISSLGAVVISSATLTLLGLTILTSFVDRRFDIVAKELQHSMEQAIAARDRAEQANTALRDSEAQFRSLVEGAPDAIFVQTEFEFVYVNAAACRLFGASSADDLLGTAVLDRLPYQLHDEVHELIRHILDDELCRPKMEQTWLRLDWTPVCVDVSAVPITYLGKPSVLVFAADITDRKSAERESEAAREVLALTEERLRLTLQSAGIGTWSWNIEIDSMEADENGSLLFGVQTGDFPETMEGFATLVHPDDQTRVKSEIDASVRDGAEYNTEFRVVWPDRNVRFVAARGKVYRREDESAYRLICVCWDVTERREAEEQLRAASERLVVESRFRELLEAAPDAVVVVDGKKTIVLVNSRAETLFGYRREELLGHSVEMLVPEGFWAQQEQELGFFSSGSQSLEVAAVRKDGVEFPVEMSLSPLETEEGLLVLSAIRDVTDRKRVELEIITLNQRLEIAASEADAANRAKSTFLSTMSHEIRTPMNAIIGYAQLMARDPTLGESAKTNLQIICRSGEHLLALINDVLDMSKIEAGRVELNPATFNLPRLLDDLAAMFRLRARAKELRFDMVVDGAPVPYIIADESKIRQALINLLGNAIKFTTLGYVKLHVTVDTKDEPLIWLTASVEDTGPGISPEEQRRLFEPFIQTKRGFHSLEGTGLGLAITRKYARLMGGDVTVQSTPGKGSTFSLSIPVERGDELVALGKSVSRHVKGIRAGTDAPRILVVDDQPQNRDWLIKLLTTLGFCARGAENGEVAIHDWRQWKPQLILMDVHMPVMDGLEATRRIKSDPAGKETPILALTASALAEDRSQVAQSGADGFLAKPCKEDELLEKMRGLLNVTYEYEDTAGIQPGPTDGVSALTAQDLARLPRELLEDIRKATVSGNKKRLDQLILGMHQSGNRDSAEGLKDLADKYEYDALTQLLEEACQR